MMVSTKENPQLSIIIRTCDNVSYKYPYEATQMEIKKFHLNNCIHYAGANNADLYVICDTSCDDYFNFVAEIIGHRGTVIRSKLQSNGGSFSKQIELALSLGTNFIEIAEDDFLKSGAIDIASLRNDEFYTAYAHPSHDRWLYRVLMKIFANELSTVCSFVAHKDLIKITMPRLLDFGEHSDAEMWRSITAPWWLELIFNLKNKKARFCSGKKYKIKRLSGVIWIHLACDSMPTNFKFLASLSFDEMRNFWENKIA